MFKTTLAIACLLIGSSAMTVKRQFPKLAQAKLHDDHDHDPIYEFGLHVHHAISEVCPDLFPAIDDVLVELGDHTLETAEDYFFSALDELDAIPYEKWEDLVLSNCNEKNLTYTALGVLAGTIVHEVISGHIEHRVWEFHDCVFYDECPWEDDGTAGLAQVRKNLKKF